jgi:porphobilinogen deaminase/uroporphyrinogen-III synthase
VPEKKITLASRDSLLALTQTIEAALRLEAAGFVPRIVCMKTAGDIKLNDPLYAVAQQSKSKEGRAFFTRELDEALVSGRADAAVHSFKDLPTEKVPGIGEPIFFCEERGSDVLLLGKHTELASDGAGLIIGTSSLRRMHQLQLILPRATTVTLRGNVITRLEKLLAGDNGINSILIASAGLRRLTGFAELPESKYAHLLPQDALEHIRRELTRLAASRTACERAIEFPERFFPTAPGQGVLALQLSKKAEERYATEIATVFAEHSQIAGRVMHERRIMSELMTGCHAPLGVSALRGDDPRIIACYSRQSTTEPVSFADSVWFERRLGKNTTAIAQELRRPTEQIFWWGAKAPAQDAGVPLHFVPAVEQKPLDARWSGETPDAVFVASQKAAEWVAAQASLNTLPMYAAGAQTAQSLQSLIPGVRVMAAPGKGFMQVLGLLTNKSIRLLWVGSADGEARARAAARDFVATEFLAVYTNLPVRPQQLEAGKDSLHVVTSAAAAQAFATWATETGVQYPLVCCFGSSAAEILQTYGIDIYHASEADDFATLIRELRGDTGLLRERWQLKEN